MLRGASTLSLDSKGRMAIPSRHRDELLERCGGRLVATVSSNRDRCLWMFPMDEWDEVSRKVVGLPSFDRTHQFLKRMVIGHAQDVEMDKSGRVLLPAVLREYAMLDKEVYLVGQGNKFEIWNEKLWNQMCEQWMSEEIDPERLSPELEQLSI